MARKLTERQRQSKQARKIKARQQWQHALWCRLRKVCLLAVFGLSCAVAYGMHTGEIQRFTQQIYDETHMAIASTGLAVEKIDLAGRGRTGMAEIKRAIPFDLGESILKVDLDDLRERLETIPTIKHASVSRNFPNRITIFLEEREPVAVWQHNGELKLIDELGAVMSDLNLHQYKNLPLLVGAGAPKHVAEVMQMLENKELAEQFESAVRVSDRRWDVVFKQGMKVKLPEEGQEKAWEKLAKMHTDEQILYRNIEAIDMRNLERMYITVAPSNGSAPMIQTKDT